MISPEEFYDKYKNKKQEVMRLALPGDGYVALVTSLFVYDLDIPQAERGRIMNKLRSNKLMEQYVNHKGWWSKLASGKIKADYFEGYIGYHLLDTGDLRVPLQFVKDYIAWGYPHARVEDKAFDLILDS